MNRIKVFRIKQGLTQIELAFITGYTQPYISSLERGAKKPNYETLYRLSKALNVPVESLSGGRESEFIERKTELLNRRKEEPQC